MGQEARQREEASLKAVTQTVVEGKGKWLVSISIEAVPEESEDSWEQVKPAKFVLGANRYEEENEVDCLPIEEKSQLTRMGEQIAKKKGYRALAEDMILDSAAEASVAALPRQTKYCIA